jgi:hypothetical protein
MTHSSYSLPGAGTGHRFFVSCRRSSQSDGQVVCLPPKSRRLFLCRWEQPHSLVLTYLEIHAKAGEVHSNSRVLSFIQNMGEHQTMLLQIGMGLSEGSKAELG